MESTVGMKPRQVVNNCVAYFINVHANFSFTSILNIFSFINLLKYKFNLLYFTLLNFFF